MTEKRFEDNECFNYSLNDKFVMEDYDGRRLYLNSEIDEDVIDSIVFHILRYNRLDKGKPVEERKPIIIYIHSPGGEIASGYSVVDSITESETPIYTVNLGFAASMAFLIFIAGHKRYSFPRAEFLMHDGSSGGVDSTAKMLDYLEFSTNQLGKMTKQYILDHTKMTEDFYDKSYRKELYLLPESAKELGVVDSIIGIDCKLSEII